MPTASPAAPSQPAPAAAAVEGVPPERMPRHIAVIMDGNGRWARARGLPRTEGHRAGVAAVRRTMQACGDLGIRHLTLYSFSSENWRRPPEEVAALMLLLGQALHEHRRELLEKGIRLRQIGRLDGLPDHARAPLQTVIDETAPCSQGTLCLALNYGSRAEIADAARSLARDAAAGRLDPESIDEGALEARLATAGMPDPDLVIRTAGEMRLSNFLLWQSSYAEFHATPTLWPDFAQADLHAAIRDFASRERRFGAAEPPNPPSS